jgi:hypothetical protein
MNIFVGTAGFSYKDWEGVVYPADLKKRKIHPLEYLADATVFAHLPRMPREFVQPTVIRQLVRIFCIETAPRTPFMRPRNANGITIAHIRGNEMTTAIVCTMQSTKATMLAATAPRQRPQPVTA